ncbi:hypothetical protein AK812_SmicGene5359 [Symbiodinium microadriaticum]|uniref:Uncharacterized protein n=1 Tax=Symbiodinium microadriaticum TaxID=2951 RepID=A0A1Q9ETT2_SYMMI|nr:hypothetical protein AK812_SmicGene5359 [Symbiodinium microadriaticum]
MSREVGCACALCQGPMENFANIVEPEPKANCDDCASPMSSSDSSDEATTPIANVEDSGFEDNEVELMASSLLQSSLRRTPKIYSFFSGVPHNQHPGLLLGAGCCLLAALLQMSWYQYFSGDPFDAFAAWQNQPGESEDDDAVIIEIVMVIIAVVSCIVVKLLLSVSCFVAWESFVAIIVVQNIVEIASATPVYPALNCMIADLSQENQQVRGECYASLEAAKNVASVSVKVIFFNIMTIVA